MERVNPELVPRRILSNGMVIPGIGMGTFGNDKYTSEEVSNAVYGGRFKQDIVCLTAQQHMEMKKISATCF